MKTCPLCRRLLYATFIDGEADFHCPTSVHLGNGIYGSHCYRISLQKCFPEYTLHIPPFVINWIDGKKQLRIYNSDLSSIGPWMSFMPSSWKDVLYWIERLKNLVPFI